MKFAAVYPLYVAKVERKGRTAAEVDEVIEWLTGFDAATVRDHLERGSTFGEFFAAATPPAEAERVTGVVCGVRVEDIEDPLVRDIRRLDKLVDELAKGRPMAKVIRHA
jgi:hypothetical protein